MKEEKALRFKSNLGAVEVTNTMDHKETMRKVLVTFEIFPEVRIINVFRKRDYLCLDVHNRSDIDEIRNTLYEIENNI